ncbi:MAG: hypothetical protein LBP75_10915 [Planctomycetota bacterium]|nr:hypothetical protein [Planctomycetota bacterium]
MPCPYRARVLWATFLPSALRWAVTRRPCGAFNGIIKITTPSVRQTAPDCQRIVRPSPSVGEFYLPRFALII